MLIYVEEEYGSSAYLWDYPHSKDRLLADWASGKTPVTPFRGSGPLPQYDGRFDLRCADQPRRTACAAYIHFHEEDDTHLILDGVEYELAPATNTRHVCITPWDLAQLANGKYGRFTFRWVSSFKSTCEKCCSEVLGMWTGSR